MSSDSNYNYKDSKEEFIIDNGILKGKERPYLTGHNSYGEFLIESLRKNPNTIGEVDGLTGKKINFSEMTEKSVKCAMWLKEQNIKTGDIVGICTHNQVDMYVPCFASLYIGAIYNPWWETGISTELAKHFLTITKPKVVFINVASAKMVEEVAREIKMNVKIVIFGKLENFLSLDDIIESQKDRVTSEFQCEKLSTIDDPAVIVYTSGTTGLPKGSVHSSRSLFGNISSNSDMCKMDDNKIISMMFSPLAWSTGVTFMLRAIALRETRIIYPEFDEEKTLELIEKFKVNWLFLGTSPATRLQQSSSLKKYDLKSLKCLFISGAAITKSTHESMASKFPGIKTRQVYGTTELGGVTIMNNDNEQFGSCGQIVPNVWMKVVDIESRRILGPNETGEALFKSPFMMTGYYDNDKATNEIIDREGWLHSGDIIYYNECGHIYVTDRIKEIIKYRGNHVSPTMVEQILLNHHDVTEVIVLGIPHRIDDEHPMAFVLRKPNAKVTEEELENLVAEALPDYMKLRGGIKFVDKMRYTPSGKIARNEMRKLLLKH